MLTRKHFKAIAEIIHQNQENDHSGNTTGKIFRDQLVDDLSDYFIASNCLFDKRKFSIACFHGGKNGKTQTG